jgi:hypothetical protein
VDKLSVDERIIFLTLAGCCVFQCGRLALNNLSLAILAILKALD